MDAKRTRGLVWLAAYHCSAQPSPGLRITLFSPQSLLRSGPSPCSAPQAQGTGADMDKDYLTLKRVPPGRTSKTMTCFAARKW
jgi:hypothetical protein